MYKQALGVDIFFYVRCPSCNKVLGHLQNKFENIWKKEIQSLYDTYPHPSEERSKYEVNIFEDIMKNLGIIRYCCRMRISNPQQIAVGNPEIPFGTISIGKESLGIVEGHTRAMTVINLTGNPKNGPLKYNMYDSNYMEWKEQDELMGEIPVPTSIKTNKVINTLKDDQSKKIDILQSNEDDDYFKINTDPVFTIPQFIPTVTSGPVTIINRPSAVTPIQHTPPGSQYGNFQTIERLNATLPIPIEKISVTLK